MLLTADWHLTAKPEDEYRWDVFRRIREIVKAKPQHVMILGDITDHKTDKHPAALVNRLVAELQALAQYLVPTNHEIVILMGNHDAPLNGVPFWHFLNELPGIRYVSEPMVWPGSSSMLLPFTKAPKWDWKNLNWSTPKCVFIHQPVQGANIGNGRTIREDTDVGIPAAIRAYAGDIHIPQTVGNVTYVGAPHWVRFGDTHARRFLEIDDRSFKVTREIPIEDGARRLIASVTSLAQLEEMRVNPGDQVRVRLALSEGDVTKVPTLTAQIREWAEINKVSLVSTETNLEGVERIDVSDTFLNDVGAIFAAFAQHEGVALDFYQSGATLLRSTLPNVEVPAHA